MSDVDTDYGLDFARRVSDAPFAVFPEKPVPKAAYWHNPYRNPLDPYRDLLLPLQYSGRSSADYPEWPGKDDPVWRHPAVQVLRRRDTKQIYRILLCITLFNEPAGELHATLRSLNEGVACLRKGAAADGTGWQCEIVVMLIQDGCVNPKNGNAIVHESTRTFLELDGELPSVWTPGADHTRVTAIVGRQRAQQGGDSAPISRAAAKWIERYDQLDMALIVSKGPNRRKYSSHAFCYAACEGLLHPDYVFLTDAGTTYERTCIRLLVEALHANRDLVGVTARQRAQTPGNMAKYGCSFKSVMKWLVSPAIAQAFEFEATFILNMAVFSILGMLPVLPGPCQLLRWNLAEEAFQKYLELVKPNATDGFIKALLRLAEDRVLSALVVLLSGARTTWVPGATFYYPPEMTLEALIKQRRRWGNGTLAANLYLVRDPDHIVADGRVPVAGVTHFMWVFQLYQSLTVALSPAVFADALQSSVLNMENGAFANGLLSKVRRSEDMGAPEIAAGAFFAVYCVWMLTSHWWQVSKSRTSRVWQYFVMLVSVVTMVIILYSMVRHRRVEMPPTCHALQSSPPHCHADLGACVCATCAGMGVTIGRHLWHRRWSGLVNVDHSATRCDRQSTGGGFVLAVSVALSANDVLPRLLCAELCASPAVRAVLGDQRHRRR